MSQPHTPLRVPDHMSRADICAYLRELRLHFGLSEADVSERLHIRVKYVTAIEQGAFDAMPGKAYARGYVHTYAEFLGLDADQVVERCFGPELAREVQAHALPSSSQKKSKAGRWSLVAVAVVLGFLGFAALHDTGGDDDASLEPDVEAVPESYLESLRTMAMPSTESIDCFSDRQWLGCFYAQHSTRAWVLPPAARAPMIAADTIVRMERARQAQEEADKAAAEAQAKEEAVKSEAQMRKAKSEAEARKKAEDAKRKAAEATKKAPVPAAVPAPEKKPEPAASAPAPAAETAKQKSVLPQTQELHFKLGDDDGDE